MHIGISEIIKKNTMLIFLIKSKKAQRTQIYLLFVRLKSTEDVSSLFTLENITFHFNLF